MARDYNIRQRTYDYRASDFDKANRVGGVVQSARAFEVFDVLQLAFGYNGLPFPNVEAMSTPKDVSATGAPLRKRTSQGTWHFCPVIFKENETDDGIILPNSFVSITARKRVVKTAMTGHDGTVKEHIGIEDYNITIRGVILDKDNAFPEEGIEMIAGWWKQNKAIYMVNALTDYYLGDDDRIVIEGHNMPGMQGKSHAQAYEYRCISDRNYELTIS